MGLSLLRQDGRASWASFHGSRTADASSPWSSSAVSCSNRTRRSACGARPTTGPWHQRAVNSRLHLSSALRSSSSLVAVLRGERLTEAQRMIAAGGIVLVMALLTMYVIFVWPAYWD